jgi:hypothetical protein
MRLPWEEAALSMYLKCENYVTFDQNSVTHTVFKCPIFVRHRFSHTEKYLF